MPSVGPVAAPPLPLGRRPHPDRIVLGLDATLLGAHSEKRFAAPTWKKGFGFHPEPRLCKAVVDRLTFNAHIVETGTESWRFKKTMERQHGKGVRRKAG